MDTSFGNNNNNAAELDRQTQSRLDEIEEEIKKQPLTSQLKPLTDLEALYWQQGEHDNNATSHFIAGVQALQKDYSYIRLVRGDGNCYYRAFLYSLAEKIMQMQSNGNNNQEGQRIVEWIKKDSWTKVLAAGYDEITMEAFYETIVELMEKIIVSSSTSSGSNGSSSFLHDEMNQENSTSDYCTWYLRVVTAMHLKSDPNRFLPFLEHDFMDMQQFCQREVEPMGKECEMVTALALAEAVGVQVKIEYLDGHALVNGKVAQHTVGPESASLHLTLLYRPGHYDILYPNTTTGGV